MTEQAHSDTASFFQRTLAALQASLSLPKGKAAIALTLGVTASAAGILLNTRHPPPASIFLTFGLTWASLVDIDRFKLPNVLTIGLVIGGLIEAASLGWEGLVDRSTGAAIGYLALVTVARLYQRLRGKPGLGLGDAKLLAAGGAWLGWSALAFIVLIASAVALAVVIIARAAGKIVKGDPWPFGPFLAAAIFWLWATSP